MTRPVRHAHGGKAPRPSWRLRVCRIIGHRWILISFDSWLEGDAKSDYLCERCGLVTKFKNFGSSQ